MHDLSTFPPFEMPHLIPGRSYRLSQVHGPPLDIWRQAAGPHALVPLLGKQAATQEAMTHLTFTIRH